MINIFFILFCIILAILFGKMINVDIPNKPKVLARVGGGIEKDNFSYYYIKNRGPIILNLTSFIGDADLYVSDTNMYPTYESELYKLHSATCGEDVIEIPETFESPLAVGVYGHAESSFYILEVYENQDLSYPYKHWVAIEREVDNVIEETKQGNKNNIPNSDKRGNSNNVLKKKKSKPSSSIPSVFSVLEILQLIFL